MRILVVKDYQELSKRAADLMASLIRLNKHTVLGLATGSTPVGAYQEMIRQCKEEGLDFSCVETYNLDEYIGLPETHEQSYHYFMNQQLLDHINIDKKNTHVPDGMAEDPVQEGLHYDQMIEDAGGIDLQLLGMGNNGHIGFNEPNNVFVVPTNVVHLTESTIKANSRFFSSEDEVPKTAISMGFKSIMQAKRILFIVSGKQKAEVVARALQGPVDPHVPASILQLHRDVLVILDQEAASALK